MTRMPPLFFLSFSLGAALLLGACSKDAPVPAQPTAATAASADNVAVARGIIDVEGGLIALVSAMDGSVSTAPVKEGAVVRKGDVLLTLDGAMPISRWPPIG
jgi:multidrug efflux pump subunit AcrA (membrane-fusion protein)